MAALSPTTSVAVVLAETDWIVADPDANAIYRIDPIVGVPELISQGGLFRFPTGVALDGDGFVLVADPDANAIFRVNVSDGSQEIVSDGLEFLHPTGVVVLPGGDLLVIDADAQAIFRVDANDGGQSFEASVAALPFATGISADCCGLLLADADANAVYRFDPLLETADLVTQDGSLVHATGIGITGGHTAVLADPDANRFVAVDLSNGDQTPAGPNGVFLSPTGVIPAPEPGLPTLLTFGVTFLGLLPSRRRGARSGS